MSTSDSDEIDDNQPIINRNQTIHHIPEAPSFESVIEEVSDLTTGAIYPTHHTRIVTDDTFDTGPEEIIRDMDHIDSPNTNDLRQRRGVLNGEHSNNSSDSSSRSTISDRYIQQPITNENDSTIENVQEEEIITQTTTLNSSNNLTMDNDVSMTKPNLNHQDSADKSANTENCTNENCENGNVIEDIPPPSILPAMPELRQRTTVHSSMPFGGIDDEFRIKLKYLNDDLKLVKGTPNEAIGDFKKFVFHFYFLSLKMIKNCF